MTYIPIRDRINIEGVKQMQNDLCCSMMEAKRSILVSEIVHEIENVQDPVVQDILRSVMYLRTL